MRKTLSLLALLVLVFVQFGVTWAQGEAPAPGAAPAAAAAGQVTPPGATPAIAPAAGAPTGEAAPAIEEVPTIPPPVGEPKLKLFGSDFFKQAPQFFEVVPETPVPPTYSLGPGDTLLIRFWTPTIPAGLSPQPTPAGSSPEQTEYKVDITPEGTIFVPLIGEMVMTGLTLEQARIQISDQLSRYYKDVKATVSLDKLRSLRVFVVGDVARPGAYTMSGLSTIFNALYFAGGPNRIGSMRNIQLIRNNQLVGTLDLYPYLLAGEKSHDLPLENGDTVFVPVIGPVVAISGEIKRPYIYELKGGERIRDLVEMAGGITATGYAARAQIERVKQNQERLVVDVDLAAALKGDNQHNVPLEDGDWITVLKVVPVKTNTIYIEGNVQRPGEYELRPGMRMKDLIQAAEGLGLRETFWERAVIFRTLPDTKIDVVPFNLRKALEGNETENLELQRWDRVVIHSLDDVRKIEKKSVEHLSKLRDWQGAKTVVILGEVAKPGIYQLRREGEDKLSSLVKEAGGLTPDGFPEGAVFLRDVSELVTPEHHTIASNTRERMLETANRYYNAALLRLQGMGAGAGGTAATGALPGPLGGITSAIGGAAEAATGEEGILAPAELPPVIPTGRVPINLKEIIDSGGTKEDVVLRNGDTVIVPPKALTVIVTGAVALPSAVVYRPGNPLEYYVKQVGGYTEDADVGRAVVIRAGGESEPVVSKTEVRPGDIVMVPPKAFLEAPKTKGERLQEKVRLVTDVAVTAYLLFLITK